MSNKYVTATSGLKVGILGLGLIGGSIGKRLVQQRSLVNQIDVYIWNHTDRVYASAQEMGMIICTSIEQIVENKVDILIIATPINVLEDIFQELSTYTEYLKQTTIIDIASVKQYPLNLAVKYGFESSYVGTHPMFGTELTGFENSEAQMGDYATWAICGENTTNMELVKRIEYFISQHLAGNPVITNAAEHDKAVALSSHIPHVLAYELAGLISDESEHMKLAKQLNAGSFHGATRVAHGNPKLFEGMLLKNYREIVPLLKIVTHDLNKLVEALDSTHSYKRVKSVHHFIERSSEFRNTSLTRKPLHAHDGDGWVKCRCGKEHWGLYGAAGLFLVRANLDGEITHVLLQHRTLWSAEGGTWGTPGGAINANESSTQGALREAAEEAGVDEAQIEVLGEVVRDHTDWKFSTIIARELAGQMVIPQIEDQESLAVEWVELDDVKQLPLLSAFEHELDELLIKTSDLLNS